MNVRLILFFFLVPVVLMYLSTVVYRFSGQRVPGEFQILMSKLFAYLGAALWFLGSLFCAFLIFADDFAYWHYGLGLFVAYVYLLNRWRRYTLSLVNYFR